MKEFEDGRLEIFFLGFNLNINNKCKKYIYK